MVRNGPMPIMLSTFADAAPQNPVLGADSTLSGFVPRVPHSDKFLPLASLSEVAHTSLKAYFLRARWAAETFTLALPYHINTDSGTPLRILEAGRGFGKKCPRLPRISAAFESRPKVLTLIGRYRLRYGFCILQVAADRAEMAAGGAQWRYA